MMGLSAATALELLATSARARFIPAYFSTNVFCCSILPHCPYANIESDGSASLLFGKIGAFQKFDLAASYFGPVPKVVGDAFQPGSCPNSNRMEKEAAIP
jgi:hypothetical protein